MLVQRYRRNMLGTDYVVGDIHGCYSALDVALNKIGFDPMSDRLFAVGDLVDRGPESHRALEWLDKPWFHACRGNHDEFVIRAQMDKDFDIDYWRGIGGGWWLDVDETLQKQFAFRFSQLPTALEIDSSIGKVGIVHADVPPNITWQEFVDGIEANDPRICDYAVWSRMRASGITQTPVTGIDRVFCGHTVSYDGQIKNVGNVWFIDTGAGYKMASSRLTVVAIDADLR